MRPQAFPAPWLAMPRSLSRVSDRYQARIVWLIPPFAILVSLNMRKHHRDSNMRPDLAFKSEQMITGLPIVRKRELASVVIETLVV
jgi:hypothetical protein